MTNSARPSSEATRTAPSRRPGVRALRQPRHAAQHRHDMSWNVNIAEVGKPGRMMTGLPLQTARHSGFPGLSATPCATMPG